LPLKVSESGEIHYSSLSIGRHIYKIGKNIKKGKKNQPNKHE